MIATGAPIVPGLTETAADGIPLHVQLIKLLSQRPGGSQRKVADALALLEQAIGEEANERVKDRISAGMALIRGLKDEDTTG